MVFLVVAAVVGFIGLMLTALFILTAIMHDTDINDVD
jgi:phage shock protein PspC (stress-responsive transcriptional regulator)